MTFQPGPLQTIPNSVFSTFPYMTSFRPPRGEPVYSSKVCHLFTEYSTHAGCSCIIFKIGLPWCGITQALTGPSAPFLFDS